MYSVIIPTMWRGIELFHTLPLVDNHPLVYEILLVNNDTIRTPKWFSEGKWKKVQYYAPPKNIYVNPVWNMGIKAAKQDKICMMTDDILFDPKIFDWLNDKITENIGLIGIAPLNIHIDQSQLLIPPLQNNIQLTPYWLESEVSVANSYAALMFLHKKNFIHPIPNDFLIHAGEGWMYLVCQRKGKINFILDNFYLVSRKHHTTVCDPSIDIQNQTQIEKAKFHNMSQMVARLIG